MSNVFGVANNSPDKIIELLTKTHSISKPTAISIVPMGSVVKGKPKNRFVFFLCPKDLVRNLRMVNDPAYDSFTFVVFGSPMKLSELTSMVPVDYEKDTDLRSHGYVACTVKRSVIRQMQSPAIKTKPVSKSKEEFVVKLISTVINGSLLGPLMTFIYTLPNSTHQGPLKVEVARWLVSGSNLLDLHARFDRMSGLHLTHKIKQKFVEILDSEVGKNFRAFFKEYKQTRAASIVPLCKKFNIDPYEVRYLLSVLSDTKTASQK